MLQHRTVVCIAFVGLLSALPQSAEAQYFGRNKVQYETLDFHVLETPNYRIHFYPEAASPVEDAARMAERWHERISRIFEHTIPEPRPLILYADHPDFQQTNILSGSVGEGTGGVTEGLMDRIILPLGTSYGDTDHVIGHELVHSFQFDIAAGGQGAGLQGLLQVPLWFIEGMAEYISLGRQYTLTAMWMRDALLNDAFPNLEAMTGDPARYFPYRFGHAFWAYIASEYGDLAVTMLMRTAARTGWEPAVERILATTPDSLSAEWRRASEEFYSPTMEGRTPPGEAGTLLLSPATGAGEMNLAPALSPDGRYVAYLSEQDIFTVELFLADARTGEVVRRLTSSTRDAHFDALRFLDTSGAWTPDGASIATVVYSEGRNEIRLYSAEDGRAIQTLRVPTEIGEVRTPSFSPDGSTIVFSGQSGGVSDLYLFDVESGETIRLTDDPYAQIQPVFSPDGSTLAYVTDAGPGTDFDLLTFGPMALSLMDVETRTTRRLNPLGDAAHYNPQFAPDGETLFFLADPEGFRNIYRVALDSGQARQVTNVVTGVSGITPETPALTVAAETGTVAFTVFENAEYHVYALDAVESDGDAVVSPLLAVGSGAPIAPAPPRGAARVEPLLLDPRAGLYSAGAFSAEDAEEYRAGLRLAAIGQPMVGAGTDQFGTYVGGSVSAYFSDLLGDRNLYTAVQAQGELQDIGGQVFYQNLGRRWNWGAGIAHVPYRYFLTSIDGDAENSQIPNLDYAIRRLDIRQFVSEAVGQVSYPFSSVRRVEFSTTYTHREFNIDEETYYVSTNGRVDYGGEVPVAGDGVPDPLNLVEGGIAFVEDNSFAGFTSPIRGFRTRIEVAHTLGTLNFTSVLADHRRYWPVFDELSIAVRGLHFGRYGIGTDGRDVIGDLFVGQESLIRGYSQYSFEPNECTINSQSQCAEYERLLGQRVGVANLEARLALLGTDRLGLLNFAYLPTDLVAFVDGGVAWNAGDGAEFTWDRESAERIPVVSAGMSLRANLLGALVFEVYYAYPFQRPEKGAHWGLFLSPGW